MTTRQNARAIAQTAQPTPTGARLDLRIYGGYEDGHLVVNDGNSEYSIPCSDGTAVVAVLAMIVGDFDRAIAPALRRRAA